MKFLDETDIELINQFLTFNTLDVHITGGCDLFTTKPVGADKKLYRTIDKQFNALIESSNHLSNHHIDENNHLINNEFLETKRRFSTNSDSVPHCNTINSLDLLNNGNNASNFSANSTNTHNSNSTSASPNGCNTRSDSFSSPTDTPFGPMEKTTSRRTFAYLIGILNSSYPDNDFSSLQPSNFIKISQRVLRSKFENTLISLGKTNSEFIWDIIDQQIELKHSAFYELVIDEPLEDDEEQDARNLWQFKWFIFNKKKKRVAFLYLNGKRLQSPKLYPVQPTRRRLTLDNDLDDEEYDLTYPSDEEMATTSEVFEEYEDDDYKFVHSPNVQLEVKY